jgi:hypothetical protein
MPLVALRPFDRRLWLGFFCAVFWLLLVLPLVVQALGLASDTRPIDRRLPRPLPGMPQSWEDWSRLPERLNAYVEDGFGLRVELIILNHHLRRLIGVSGVPGVMVGTNNWQYLSNANDITNQHRGINLYNDKELDRKIDNLEAYRDWLDSKGIKFIFAVVPNQQTVYPEYLPHYVTKVSSLTRADQLMLRLKERGSTLEVVDLRAALISRKGEGRLYTLSESHWLPQGALIGHNAIMHSVRKFFPDAPLAEPSDYRLVETRRDFPPVSYGEIYFDLQHIKEDPFSIRTISDTNLNDTWRAVESAQNHGPRALFLADSFVEMMLQFIARSFNSALVTHHQRSGLAIGAIETFKPEIVIMEMVERFLPSAFTDVNAIPISLPPPLSELGGEPMTQAGYVDDIEVAPETLEFRGWSIDPDAKIPPRTVAVFVDGKAVAVVRPSFDRPDVTMGLADKRAGFRLRVSRQALVGGRKSVLVVAFFPDGSLRRIAIHGPQQYKLPQ